MASSSHYHPQLLALPQLISAKQKISKIAAFYENNSSSNSLKAFFDTNIMSPTEFRQQLKSNLFVSLTDEELGAMVVYLDRIGDKTVTCDEFIKQFFVLGKEYNEKLHLIHREESNRRESRYKVYLSRHDERYKRIISKNIDVNYSMKDQVSGLNKIAYSSFHYKPSSNGLKVLFH